MSDRAIPRSFRFMEGFGVHTYRLVTAAGKSTFVKFHWKPKLGLQSVVWNEAVKINGVDPDFHRRDLWNAIQSGGFPEWELGFQLFDDKFAEKFEFDVLDPTKLIPEELIPIRRVGRLVLDRCVDNFFAETEQVAFCTNNIIRGIDFSNDPLLQGRNFSYLDTQVKRLGGPNFAQIPINAPKCPFHHLQQDGHMAMVNPVGRVNYEPNSIGGAEGGPRESPEIGFRSFEAEENGRKVRERSASFADHYSQARLFFISQTPVEQGHIAEALIFELSKVENPAIRMRMVGHLPNIDGGLADRVTKGLGIREKVQVAKPAVTPLTNLKPSNALSIVLNPPTSFEGRRVGVMVTDGVNLALLDTLKKEIKIQGATMEVIAPVIGGAVSSDGRPISVKHKIGGGPSVLYDAVAILPSEEGTQMLLRNAAATEFIADAFVHCKFIAWVRAALPLFEKAGIAEAMDEACIELTGRKSVMRFLSACKRVRHWEREKVVSF
jgi:catalase